MELRRHICVCACLLISLLELCRTDMIDVTFTATTVTPSQLTYTIDVDPYDRMYNCLVENDDTEKEWNHVQTSKIYPNPLNVYDLYEDVKEIGSSLLTCYRKNVDTNPSVGTIPLEIIEGGHIVVDNNSDITKYTSDVALTTLELTPNVTLTCSARTGEWRVPSGDTSRTFPVVTLPSVGSRRNGTFSCRRIIAETVLFSVQLQLMVVPTDQLDVSVTGTGGMDSSEELPSFPFAMSSTVINEPSSTPVLSSSSIFSSTPVLSSSSIFSSSSILSSSSNTIYSIEQTQVFSSSQSQGVYRIPSSSYIIITPSFSTVIIPTSSSIVASVSSYVVSPTPSHTSIVARPEPTTSPTPPSTTYSTPSPSSSAYTVTSTVHTSTLLPTPTPSTFLTTVPVVKTTSSYMPSSSSIPMSSTRIQETTVSSSMPLNTSSPSATSLPSINDSTAIIAAIVLGILGVLFLFIIVVVVIVWILCATSYKKRNSKRYEKTPMEEKQPPVSPATKPIIPLPYQPMPSINSDVIDPFFSVEVSQGDFKARVDELWDHECNLLVDEYNALGGTEFRYPTDQATGPYTKPKNRYRNILPYDRSRVVLAPLPDVPRSDYINASLVPGVHVKQEFICSQGPRLETVDDMWRMLWQNQVARVVMLTKLFEGGKSKCQQYWPDKVGDGQRFGGLFVTFVGLEMDKHWVVRDLAVSDESGEETLHVRQYQFTGWPDFDAPRFPHDLIGLLRKVRSEATESARPICVHCSAGVGRSGTFIALFNLLAAIEEGRHLSVFNVVNEMREHRPMIVQAFPQYRFIYLAILELLQGDTSVPEGGFPIFYQTRLNINSPVFADQFAELEYQAEKSFTRDCVSALAPEAVNPDPMVLPYDDRAVLLSGPHWDGDTYINASHLDGFSGSTGFIATQIPVCDSVRDTMQLISQTQSPLVVLMTSVEGFEGMKFDEGRIRYWPDPMTQHEFDGFNLMNESQLVHPLTNRLKLVSKADGSEVEFSLVTLLDWTDGAEFKLSAEGLQRVSTVLGEIERALERTPDRPVILQCRDGAGASGVLAAAYNAICQAKEERQVDIFQTIKRLRYCRPSMVNSLDQYLSVHAIVSSYLAEASCEGAGPTHPYISSL